MENLGSYTIRYYEYVMIPAVVFCVFQYFVHSYYRIVSVFLC